MPGSYLTPRSGRNYGYNDNPYVQYDKSGIRWRPGGAEKWSRNNYFDERGFLRGDFPYVPQELALAYQAEHDQRVYQYRDRVMRDAIAESRGANRLMQSYRPGGSAAIEANTYGRTAALQMQRASMIEPMDLMADYRRHVRATQKKRRQFAFEMQLYAGIGGAIASYWLPQYAGISKSLLSGAADSYEAATAAEAGDEAQPGRSIGGDTVYMSKNEPTKKQGEATGSSTIEEDPGSSIPGMGGGGAIPGGFGTGSATLDTGNNVGGQQTGGGSTLRGSPQTGSGGGAGAGGGGGQDQPGGTGASLQGGGTSYVPGSDGDFSSMRRAAYAAERTPYVDTYLSAALVDSYENDPFYEEYEAEIDRQMMLRRTG